MSETRTFHIGTILSGITGRLLAPGGMEEIHGFLDWMTGDSLLTHQLPRALDESAPSLRRQFPSLAAVDVPDFGGSKDALGTWLGELARHAGATREVTPLAPEDHTHIDPLTELSQIVPPEKIVTVVVPNGKENDQ